MPGLAIAGLAAAGLAGAAALLRFLAGRRRSRRERARLRDDSQRPVALAVIEKGDPLEPASILYGQHLRLYHDPHEPARRRPDRYANVVMSGSTGGRVAFVGRDPHAVIAVDIGELRRDSDVIDPERFPDDRLPDGDLEIRVLLSCAAQAVGVEAPGDAGGARTAEQSLVLPADGGSSRTKDGSGRLRFALALPDDCAPTRARLSYLFRDTVVQSQRLELVPVADLGPGAMRLEVRPDFTLSGDFVAGVGEIVERPRISILANANSDDEHEVTVRPPGGGPGEGTAFRLRHERFAKAVERLREALEERAPRRRKRSARELGEDLRALAPIGWQLYAALHEDARKLIHRERDDLLVQVLLPDDSSFSLPWSFLYDIPLESHVERPSVCAVVEEIERGELELGPSVRRCPHADADGHAANILCPFGFWGVRKSFELLSRTSAPKTAIELGADSRVMIGQTERGVNRKRLARHVEAIGASFRARSPGTTIEEARTKEAVQLGLSADLPFVYFLCHGERAGSGQPARLGVGANETITPEDFIGWVDRVYATTTPHHELWTDPRPLVFINACESLAIGAGDLVDYLRAFVNTAHAVGVIGTEVKVQQEMAMEVGEAFFAGLLSEGATVESVLREIRFAFLGDCNLFGLLYTPYCFADLHVA